MFLDKLEHLLSGLPVVEVCLGILHHVLCLSGERGAVFRGLQTGIAVGVQVATSFQEHAADLEHGVITVDGARQRCVCSGCVVRVSPPVQAFPDSRFHLFIKLLAVLGYGEVVARGVKHIADFLRTGVFFLFRVFGTGLDTERKFCLFSPRLPGHFVIHRFAQSQGAEQPFACLGGIFFHAVAIAVGLVKSVAGIGILIQSFVERVEFCFGHAGCREEQQGQ